MNLDDYCRELEAHLCRRNGGHLVRIVGPAFEKVCEWGRAGIPLKVAMQGIDRYIERQEARGGHRRPARIEFCEADVRDAFDAWRRAVGVRARAGDDEEAAQAPPAKRRRSLAGHIERVVARLTVLRGGTSGSEWARSLEAAVRELDALRGSARKARGEAREAVVAALVEVDRRLLDSAVHTAAAGLVAQATEEAIRELAPFRERLRVEAWDDAVRRGRDVVLRERLGLPAIVFE
ncbi:MAG: hypothetical protein AB1806_14620 [Acidobacteriota bacterium]